LIFIVGVSDSDSVFSSTAGHSVQRSYSAFATSRRHDFGYAAAAAAFTSATTHQQQQLLIVHTLFTRSSVSAIAFTATASAVAFLRQQHQRQRCERIQQSQLRASAISAIPVMAFMQQQFKLSALQQQPH
jgi:hypothetical protein